MSQVSLKLIKKEKKLNYEIKFYNFRVVSSYNYPLKLHFQQNYEVDRLKVVRILERRKLKSIVQDITYNKQENLNKYLSQVT